MLKIRIASLAGFCMGVRRAVNLTLEESRHYDGKLHTLGALIHNPQIVDLLSRRSIRAIQSPEEIASGKVIIRAHGVPPDTLKAFKDKGIAVLDATCPHVSRIHKIIGRHLKTGGDIVIVGDRGHAEVTGLEGAALGKAHVVSSLQEWRTLPHLTRPCVVAQTTQSVEKAKVIYEEIKARYPDAALHDTICRSTEERQAEMVSLGARHDLVLVVGGKTSANTQRLVEVVKEAGGNAVAIEHEGELNPRILAGVKSVLVAAGASTPNWLIHRVAEHLRKMEYAGRSALFRWIIHALEALAGAYVGLAAIATVLLLAVWRVGKQPVPDYRYLLIVFAYIAAMYTLNHLTNIEANQLQEVFARDPVNRFRKIYMAGAILLILAAVSIAFVIHPYAGFFVLLMAGAGIIYNIPIIPARFSKNLRPKRIKDVPLSKDITISLAWTSVIVILPFFSLPFDTGILPSAALMGLLVAGLSFLHALGSDLQDIQKDLFVGRETIPIHFGKTKVRWVALTIVAILILLLVTGSLSGILKRSAFILALLPLSMGILLELYHREKLPRFSNLRLMMEIAFGLTAVGAFASSLLVDLYYASFLGELFRK